MIKKIFTTLLLFFPLFSHGERNNANNNLEDKPLVLEKGGGGDVFISYLTQWLKNQKYTDFSVIENGVILNQPKASITANIHEISQRNENNFTVETHLIVTFADGHQYEDFFAGFGKNPQSAFAQSIYLACLTTFSPIFSSLTEQFPDNIRKLSWTIAEKDKAVYMGDWAFVGQGNAEAALVTAVEEVLPLLLSKVPLKGDSQWVKIILLKEHNKPAHVELTINGTSYNEVDEILSSFEWSETESFYIGKLFFVINTTNHDQP